MRVAMWMGLALAAPALAQEGPKEIIEPVTEIEFGTVQVDGELVRPGVHLVAERRQADFNPLVRLRTDFDQEMKRSVDEIE